MTAKVVITKAGFGDAATVALLLSELNRTVGVGGLPEELSRLPEHTNLAAAQAGARLRNVEGLEIVLLAEVDSEPAGFTAVRTIPYLDQDTPYVEVTQLHVRPRFRRQGVASELIAAAEGLAQEAGATCVHILTGVDNLEAQAFYRSIGYEVECLDFEKFLGKRPTANAQLA